MGRPHELDVGNGAIGTETYGQKEMAPKVGQGTLALEELVPDPFNPAAPQVQVTGEIQ
jgi:hypothetical protein